MLAPLQSHEDKRVRTDVRDGFESSREAAERHFTAYI